MVGNVFFILVNQTFSCTKPDKELDPRTIKMCPNFFSKFDFKIVKPCITLYCSTQYPA